MGSFPAKLLDRFPPWLTLVLGAAGVGLVGVVDYLTGAEISFAIFYLLPIAFTAWFGGRAIGLVVSITACAAWLAADLLAAPDPSHPLIPFWNGAVRLMLFALIAFMLSEIHRRLDIEERLARTDPLTGALNGLAFRERAEAEIGRARRYGRPFTLAYLDVDDFKHVNDQHGHQTGDRALSEIVDAIRGELRETDTIARLGGDELAVLLIETSTGEARAVIDRVRGAVDARMQRAGWPLSLSIGAVTFERPPNDVAEMVRLADSLMYSVKQSGKNGAAHELHPRPVAGAPVDPRKTRNLRPRTP